ncbi:MAG: lactate racemase domain-containing protein [Candidatus Xenobia bacterium]
MTDSSAGELIRQALAASGWRGRRVLVIVPDLTRSAPVPLVFNAIFDAIGAEVACLDVLIALGTHQPLSFERFCQRVGIAPGDYRRYEPKVAWFNHAWDDPAGLRHIGTIPADEVRRLSEGIFGEALPVEVSARIFDYDHVMVIGPVFPHEVVGFSGGNKYFFPGVAGESLIHMFHWLGALITNPVINGTIHTPVRAVIDRAAAFLTVPRTYFHLVVHHGELHGLYVGDAQEAWEQAARHSARVNIRYVPQRYRRVLGVAPEKYEDLWTAGKVVYKSEPIVEDGGEVVIYAPHITEVSVTHGADLLAVGYHTRDYFTAQAERFAHVPGAIRAHSTHVRGIGTFVNGVEKPRIQVTLATRIPPETCARINLGYLDPARVDVEAARTDADTLVIPDAGEVLYRVAT